MLVASRGTSGLGRSRYIRLSQFRIPERPILAKEMLLSAEKKTLRQSCLRWISEAV